MRVTEHQKSLILQDLMMRIEAIGPSNATATPPPMPVAPVVATTSSQILGARPSSEPAIAEKGVSYVSTIPVMTPAPLPAKPEKFAERSVVGTVSDTAPMAAAPERIEPAATAKAAVPADVTAAANPTTVDQVTASNRDPTQAALAATAVAMSRLAPPPFGPSIIIPDDSRLATVTSISAGAAPAGIPETPADPSLYALFQTAIVANGAAQAVDVVRRTIADLIPKAASPVDAAPVA